MKLLIRNIDRSVTETQLRTLFEAYGTIQSCTIVLDKQTGESKGFGFIEMPKPGEAKAAAINLNGKDLQGSKLRVKKAETITPTTSVAPTPARPNPYKKSK